MDDILAIHAGRLAAASATVLITTLEDAVWLVPLVLHASNFWVGLVHAVTFVTAFTLLSLSVGLVTVYGLDQASISNLQQQDVWFSAFGAALCWLIAGVLWYRAWKKRQQQRQCQNEQQDDNRIIVLEAQEEEATANLLQPVIESEQQRKVFAADVEQYGSVVINGEQQSVDDGDDDNDVQTTEENQLQIWLVISLTIVGAIDEIIYFPALIAGKIFSVAELTVGTLLASVFILLIVCVALAPCKPILDVLDNIPLYSVVAFFAMLLTVNTGWDYFKG